MQNTENADIYISHVHGLLHWEKNLPNKTALVQLLVSGQIISKTKDDIANKVHIMSR